MFTFDHYQFTEVTFKCLSCLVSAENTCTFNNDELFKKFKEKTCSDSRSHYMYTCIGSWENGNCYPPYQDVVYTSPHRGHQKFQREGAPKGGNFQGGGVRFSRFFFSRDFETRIIVFIDDFTLTVIAECFFHSLPVWYYSLHVYYECHRFMNYAGNPAHCLIIFHNTIVV